MQRIYFIHDHASHAVKIGFTVKPIIHRFKQIQTCNPNPLELIGFIPGRRRDEARLHRRYERFRRRGEWFRDDAELLHEINLILMTGLPL